MNLAAVSLQVLQIQTIWMQYEKNGLNDVALHTSHIQVSSLGASFSILERLYYNEKYHDLQYYSTSYVKIYYAD